MPDEKISVSPGNKMMSVKEIFEISSIFTGLGIRKIRLTGGEPLVRVDAADIMHALSSLPIELSISTNGVLVDQYIDVFKTKANK